ncbi:disulfide bond formation protein DsbB [Thiohalobacter thiocyanaticus]|uniref:Disulfide bond formation protein DsbB n=1 Tax=Thiohalobacter thiocyanaticus TaxID=585455 RepID=A0A1Z4VMV7_9GAMM|nr:disulfide bond formation protein B [Thiohalobacter thiocyanaticus]BAZ92835.1 disulfide bond formation protein DsbB [Thiohalobacter thiocyanaticus]
MLERLNRIGTSAFYWLALLVLVLLLEGVALFYQYRLDYWPCVLCIHVRIWLAALGLLALLMLALRRLRGGALLGHLATAGIGLGLLERAWLLLGTERGFIEDAGCGMDLGLPAWLALDDWLPWLFEAQTSCGYTPELPLGITMAEALLAFSAALTLLGLGLALATLAAGRR